MTAHIFCDICGRQAPEYLTFTGPFAGLDGELHVCKPRDGGDTGCSGFLAQGIMHAREQALRWLSEHNR